MAVPSTKLSLYQSPTTGLSPIPQHTSKHAGLGRVGVAVARNRSMVQLSKAGFFLN